MLTEPKKRFLEQESLVKSVQDVVDSRQFATATDAALLQYVISQVGTADQEESAARFNRICGAVEFLKTLGTVSNKPSRPEPRMHSDNLNHNA